MYHFYLVSIKACLLTKCLSLNIFPPFQAVSHKSTDQVSSLKEEHQKALTKLQEEVESLKNSVSAKTEEVNEKNKTLLQVRTFWSQILGWNWSDKVFVEFEWKWKWYWSLSALRYVVAFNIGECILFRRNRGLSRGSRRTGWLSVRLALHLDFMW